jgi:hypothetical protein
MRFEEWFQSKQGESYASMFMFAKDAWADATAQEREACAKVCEETHHPFGWSAETEDWTGATDNCAAAIRARSDLWDEDRIDVIAQNGNDGIHYSEQK